MQQTLKFFCWKEDTPTEIQLEPEGMVFKIQAGEEIGFIAEVGAPDFYWSVTMYEGEKFAKVFAEGSNYSIKVYKDGEEIW